MREKKAGASYNLNEQAANYCLLVRVVKSKVKKNDEQREMEIQRKAKGQYTEIFNFLPVGKA